MRYLLLFLLPLVLHSCANSFEKETIIIEDKYSISLPNFLSKSKTLNDDASLQYQNLLREFYVIVIDETKEEVHDLVNNDDNLFHISTDFDGYKRLITENMSLAINFNKVTVEETTKINGMTAYVQSMEGNLQGHDIFYKIGLVEGKDHYYQIFVWTLLDKKSEYESIMDDILNSFKEVKHKKQS